MFGPNLEVAIKEMLRVTKCGVRGRIAFAMWAAALANGRLFEAIAKHLPNFVNEPSPTLWEFPEVIKKRRGSNSKVKNIHFEQRVFKYLFFLNGKEPISSFYCISSVFILTSQSLHFAN